MQLAIAQLNQIVGDLAANARGILAAVGRRSARRRDARRHARAVAVRLSAGGPAAAAGVHRRRAPPSWQRWRRKSRGATVLVGFPGAAAGRRYNAMAVIRDGRVAAGLPQAVPAELHGVRRGALFRAGRRAVRVRRRRRALRASSSARTSGSRNRRHAPRPPARRCSWSPTARRTTRGSRRCAASRSRRGCARAACRSSTSIASAARTNSCSTARRSSSTRTSALAQQLPAWHETVAIAHFDGAAPRHVRGGLDPALEAARVRSARDGRARLRRQEPLSRRAARPVRRRRLRADAGGGRRRARSRIACAR